MLGPGSDSHRNDGEIVVCGGPTVSCAVVFCGTAVEFYDPVSVMPPPADALTGSSSCVGATNKGSDVRVLDIGDASIRS